MSFSPARPSGVPPRLTPLRLCQHRHRHRRHPPLQWRRDQTSRKRHSGKSNPPLNTSLFPFQSIALSLATRALRMLATSSEPHARADDAPHLPDHPFCCSSTPKSLAPSPTSCSAPDPVGRSLLRLQQPRPPTPPPPRAQPLSPPPASPPPFQPRPRSTRGSPRRAGPRRPAR